MTTVTLAGSKKEADVSNCVLASRFVDSQRLWARISDLGKIGLKEGILTRLGYSKEEDNAIVFLEKEMRDAGMFVWQDTAGNLHGRIGSMTGKAILIGSHADSVKNAGMFDGAAGVCAAIEVVKAIQESGVQSKAPIEVIAFRCEESNRFDAAFIGSAVALGLAKPLLFHRTDSDGRSLGEVLTERGLSQAQCMKPEDYHAFIELHVEQGGSLLESGLPVGIVTAIAGTQRSEVEFNGENAVVSAAKAVIIIRDAAYAAAQSMDKSGKEDGFLIATVGDIQLGAPSGKVNHAKPGYAKLVEVTLEGESNHSGFTPIKNRKDALVAACKAITAIDGSGVTIHGLEVDPPSINKVPGKVKLTLDVEAENEKAYRTKIAEILQKMEGCVFSAGVTLEYVENEVGTAVAAPQNVKIKVDMRGVEFEEISEFARKVGRQVEEKARAVGSTAYWKSLSSSTPQKCSGEVSEVIRTAVETLELTGMVMPSAAGHDAMKLIEAGVPSGMIFVRSAPYSHSPKEYASAHDLRDGTKTLAAAVVLLSEQYGKTA